MAPELFADLVAWRGGQSVTDHHATSRPVETTEESERAARSAAYRAGLVTPPKRRTRADELLADSRAFGLGA